MKKKHSVSLCMIVKNEEKVLGNCLENIHDIVDEIIIVDTGSTDNTVAIAKQYGARVEYFEWTYDFSEARNFSLSFATKEWILVLDADEFLNVNDKENLLVGLNNDDFCGYYIKTLNYSGSVSDDYIVNLNLRIFKNNGNYRFSGKIHEFVAPIHDEMCPTDFGALDVGFYHVGYLTEIVNEKEKRARNIDIIERILLDDPENAFHLFNLGTENNSLGNYEKALEYYNMSYSRINIQDGFAPKLIIFRIYSMIGLTRFNEAMQAIKEGLELYPEYTDLVFLKGLIHRMKYQVTQAISCFELCMKMGKPPVLLENSNSSYNAWPLLQLANIYEEFEDDEKAIHYYNEYLRIRPHQYSILYSIGSCLKRVHHNGESVAQNIKQYLNMTQSTSWMLLFNILYKLGYNETVLKEIEGAKEYLEEPILMYYTAKNYFYQREFKNAAELFIKYNNGILEYDNLPYLFIIKLIEPGVISSDLDYRGNNAYILLERLGQDKERLKLDIKDKPTMLNDTFFILKELIVIKELKLFEKLLEALNEIDSDDVLLRLAKLYDEFGFDELAKNEIFRSIKHFEKLDRESVKLLLKYIK